MGTLARAVAKKVRTPPPPRRVQAPQRRETRRPRGPQRSPWLYAVAGALVAAAIAAAVVGIVVARGGGSATTKTAATNYNALPGIRKTKAPWPPEYLYLADRLAPLDLTTLGGHNGLVLHFHTHIDIFVNGKKVKVPALVGINPGAGYLTELHTHDDRGVIHIEAQKSRDFTVGQFFAEWAVYLDSHSIGGYSGMKWYLERQAADRQPRRPSSSSRTRRSRSSSASRPQRFRRASPSSRASRCRGRDSNPYAPLRGHPILSRARITSFATPARSGYSGSPRLPEPRLRA